MWIPKKKSLTEFELEKRVSTYNIPLLQRGPVQWSLYTWQVTKAEHIGFRQHVDTFKLIYYYDIFKNICV